MKELPLSSDSFFTLRIEDKYFVDKTPFIKKVLKSDASVLLITRPRRFGKTMFMDMLYRFLGMNFEEPEKTSENEKLFSGLKVLEDKEFCRAYMGKFPVVSLTLKGVRDKDYTSAYKAFADCISENAESYKFLLSSPKLSADQKDSLTKYGTREFLRKIENKDYVKTYLRDIVCFLAKHFGRQVIVLIDEYDVPLAKAAKHGYYEDMLPVVQGFLGEALKPSSQNSPYLKKAILTGCLRVGKESIFTDFNNPDVNTVCSDDLTLAEAIGFTASETKELLRYYGLASQFDEVQRWYDGYRFAGRDIYCPWDLINFCSKSIVAAPDGYPLRNYWIGTSGNDVVDTFLGFLSGEDTEKMQTLVDGGSIEVDVNETLNYGELKEHKPRDFWTLLLFTGYLTVAERLPQSANCFKLKIPNEEIRDTFVRKVKSRFSDANETFVNRGLELVRSALAGDIDKITEVLSSVLMSYVSIRDTATKAPRENYYHGMLVALCACGSGLLEYFKSNAESGDGYADIVFTDKVPSSRTGVVIEIKYVSNPENLYDAAQSALDQIKAKKYTDYLDKFRCKKGLLYGVAFSGKSCAVLSEEK